MWNSPREGTNFTCDLVSCFVFECVNCSSRKKSQSHVDICYSLVTPYFFSHVEKPITCPVHKTFSFHM
uniref:Uncharacterized protein n=1 Tax=Anguilla anguilla TaxID=7936 RepID=A0A0E9ULS4_ANGAN